MKRSKKPFAETLKALLEEHDISQRGLALKTKEHAKRRPNGPRDAKPKPLSVPAVNKMVRGEFPPSYEAMEIIAAALGESPEVFAEYRLDTEKRKYDWRIVGLKKALVNLGER